MTTPYRLRCGACGGPGENGLRVESEARAYVGEDEGLVPLPRPLGPATFRDLGTTWHRAALRGRVLRVRNLVCVDCGTLNADVSTTGVSGAGCLTALLLAVAAYVLLHHVLAVERGLALLGAYVLLVLPVAAMSLYVGLRYRERTRRLGFSACVRCGWRRGLSPGRARRRTLPCPSCGEKTLKITTDR
jgi:hypothetical protein